jgi:hypothetical protein
MKTFLNIAKFLPVIISGVLTVEATIEGEGKGTAKKQIVLDAIQTAAEVGESLSDADVALASTMIDRAVGALKATGVFASKAPATPAPTPAS